MVKRYNELDMKNELVAVLKKDKKTFVTDNLASTVTGRGKTDLIILHNGFTIYVELKHPSRLSSVPDNRQQIIHRRIRRAGGYVLISRSVKRVLQALEIVDTSADVLSTLQQSFGDDGMLGLDEVVQ